MKKMLWGGRFKKGPAKETIDFNSAENVRLDYALVPYDIYGSLAHARMLYSREILSVSEYEAIRGALKNVLAAWRKGSFILFPELEDVHMNVEHAVTEATPAGKKLHTARSRNDQVLLDMRLYMRDRILDTISALGSLQNSFAELSGKDGPMSSYTHTRVAQPITVSFWCDGWSRSLARDAERLMGAYARINQNPLGACAIAGTAWGIDRQETAGLLAFDSVQENELDTISSRGECEAEALFALSMAGCKLSRLSEEMIWLSQKGLVSLSEEHTTGSSIMPNKLNPDVLELVRGRSGRLYGALMHAMVALKGIPSGYNSDMQETKFAIMGGFETALSCLHAAGMVVRGLEFHPKKIGEELDSGFAQATEIADFLAMGGMPFREAHERTGELIKWCEKEGLTLSQVRLKDAEGSLRVSMGKEKWEELRSLERPRLKRKVPPIRYEFVERERKRIEEAYSGL
ncbi:MAG: argininosuccinate lyase [Candidatus Micrarchaeota archaeon]